MLNNDGKPPVKRGGIFGRLRSWFFTGLLVTAPVLLTVYITWAAIKLIDRIVVNEGEDDALTPMKHLRDHLKDVAHAEVLPLLTFFDDRDEGG